MEEKDKNEVSVSQQVEELKAQLKAEKEAREALDKQLQHAGSGNDDELAELRDKVSTLERELKQSRGSVQVQDPTFKTEVVRNGEKVKIPLKSYECECVASPAGRPKLPKKIIVDVPDPSEARRQYLSRVGPRTSKYTVHVREVPRPKDAKKIEQSTPA